MAEFSGQLSLQATARADGRTVLSTQAFRAPYHLSKPYWDEATRTLLVQIVNPTAGILAGDRLESNVAVGPGGAVLLTTPSASRVFKMKAGWAECRQQLKVAAGGWLEVMPEPLVPHRGSRYRQITTIEVEPGGGLFYADVLMPGRVGHGEAWAWENLCLQIDVRLGGELMLRERLEQGGPELQSLAQTAGSGAGACFGTAVLIGEAGENDFAWQAAISALHGNGLWVGLSRLRRGGCSIKCVASDALRLREALAAIRQILARPYPHLRCDPRKL